MGCRSGAYSPSLVDYIDAVEQQRLPTISAEGEMREIIVTEGPRLHLVWIYDRVFIKPLPRYLLSYTFWSEHISNEKSKLWGSNKEEQAHGLTVHWGSNLVSGGPLKSLAGGPISTLKVCSRSPLPGSTCGPPYNVKRNPHLHIQLRHLIAN